ncbi:MAG: hypothetical protein M0009_03895 [Deltaproteobacteria bacterium]|nr:hypothetical protein [Deltaproteobacteria bacterium]
MKKRSASTIGTLVFSCALVLTGLLAPDRARAADDGTITIGNLVYAKTINCYGMQGWDQAMSSAAQLKSGDCGLNDGSKAGQWRLPSTYETWGANKSNGFLNAPSWPRDCFWTNREIGAAAPDYAECAGESAPNGATSNKSTPQNVVFVRPK